MKTLHWVLLALSGWLTLAALVETIEGYAFLDSRPPPSVERAPVASSEILSIA